MNLGEVTVAGAHRVTWKNRDIGHTLDGITFRKGRTLTEVHVDAYGSSPIDWVLSGDSAEVTFKLAQDGITQYEAAMPENVKNDQPGVASDRMDIGRVAGFSLRSIAGPLVLHPLNRADSDKSKDITLYLVASKGDTVEIPLLVDGQKAFEITMGAMVSEQYGPLRTLGHVGNSDIS